MSLQAVQMPPPVHLSSVVTKKHVTHCGQMIMCHLCNLSANVSSSEAVTFCDLSVLTYSVSLQPKVLALVGKALTYSTHPARLRSTT